jgi:NADH-quinone oxidoreductase subunit L
MIDLIWLVPVFPLAGFVINGLFGFSHLRERAHLIAVPAAGLSCLVALLISVQVFAGATLDRDLYPWLVAGALEIPTGFLVDPLSTVMMVTVTVVGFLVHVYSIKYMYGDPGYPRFFAYLNLFLFCMLVLVLANNYLLMFLGWEGVGLCSYLLIGFWYERKSATDAGNKAFIVNRVGDAGFLLGLFLIWTVFGSVRFADVFPVAGEVLEPGSTLVTVMTLALFVGAVGKSAQFPLYVWLPDAMEGPTPTSALIHAATMVTAGVYMVARSAPLFSLAPDTSALVALVGALTAVLAATMGCVQSNIKQTIAYSTITQLGYMFLMAGLGAYATAIFHLFAHAFFKSLLFLGAGSVIQTLHGEHDVRRMGGLAPHMRVTAYAFLVGVLASAGIFPLAGFWTQGHAMFAAFNHGRYFLWGLGLSAAFLTAFYMFRLYLLTFGGRRRIDPRHAHHLREAPANIWIPLVALACLSLTVGFVGLTPEHGAVYGLLGRSFPDGTAQGLNAPLRWSVALLPLGVAAVGMGLAWLSYAQWWHLPDRFRTLYVVLFRRYFVDEIYYAIFLDGFRRVCRLLWRIDRRMIDGAVNTVVTVVLGSSAGSSRLDERVVDGAVNRVAAFIMGTSDISWKTDQRVVDGAVNTVATFIVGTSDMSWKADQKVVDRGVDMLAELGQGMGDLLRKVQTGLIQNYFMVMALGILLIAGFLMILR